MSAFLPRKSLPLVPEILLCAAISSVFQVIKTEYDNAEAGFINAGSNSTHSDYILGLRVISSFFFLNPKLKSHQIYYLHQE